MDSVPGCEWDGVDPSWSFTSPSPDSRESSSSPTLCECDVVGKVVVVSAKYMPQEFELISCDVPGQRGNPCTFEHLLVGDCSGSGVDDFRVICRGDVKDPSEESGVCSVQSCKVGACKGFHKWPVCENGDDDHLVDFELPLKG